MSGEWDDWIDVWHLRYALARLGDSLTASVLVRIWVEGLVAAGVAAKVAKVWVGKYPRHLPFVIEFPCPYGHRTQDRYDRATTRIIVEDNGWWSLDPASPCPECSSASILSWLLTCPRCWADEDSDRHDPDHEALFVDRYRLDGEIVVGGDTSPLAWVMDAFAQEVARAEARWWTEHYSEAVAELGALAPPGSAARRLQNAQAVLAQTEKRPSRRAVSIAPKVSPEAAADWLDNLRDLDGDPLVPPHLGGKATWAMVSGVAGHPPQSVVYAAVKLRKERATSA